MGNDMNFKNARFYLTGLLSVLLFSNSVLAGGDFECSAIANGNWSDAATWNCTGGSSPPISGAEFVTIRNGFTVTLDTDVSMGSLRIFDGGDLNVAASASGYTLSWTAVDVDLSSSSIDLAGDLIISVANNRNFTLGAVDGPHNITINATGQARLQGDIGGTTPLNTLTTNAGGSTLISADVRTSSFHAFDDPVLLGADVTFSGSNGTFMQGLNAGGNSLTLEYTDTYFFPSSVAPLANVNNLTLGASLSRGDSPFTQLDGDIETLGSQTYIAPMFLLFDATLTSLGNGNIAVGVVDGPQALTINTGGQTRFNGNVGLNTRLSSLSMDMPGTNFFTNPSRDFQFDGSDAVYFGGDTVFGGSNRVIIDQIGTGNIVFDGTIDTNLGGPHRLTVNDVSGRTEFTGDIRLGELTTNDGAGDDVTVIGSGSVTTRQGGSNSGVMAFNDPVIVAGSITFVEENNGRIEFNNSLNTFTGRGMFIDVEIQSDNQVRLGPVGNEAPFDILTTDPGGSTLLTSDVLVRGPTEFGDAVVVASDLSIGLAVDGSVEFLSTLDDDGDAGTGSAVTVGGVAEIIVLDETGGTNPLDSLVLQQRTILNGDVDVLGTLSFTEPASLNADVTMSADEIILNNVNGFTTRGFSNGLTLEAATSIQVGGNLGTQSLPLQSFRSTGSAPITFLNDSQVNTNGSQSYGGPVNLNNPVVMTGDNITLPDRVDLAQHSLELSLRSIGEALGPISGTGSIIKQGSGFLILSAENTFSGGLFVNEGLLRLAGSTVAANDISVDSASFIGSGTAAGSVVLTNGFLSAEIGNSSGLSTGDLLLDQDSTLEIIIDGISAGNEYSQVLVTGGVTLGNATLSLFGEYRPNGLGAELVLVDNDGVDPVLDTFANLAEGELVDYGLGVMILSYLGGDGNDVVLLDTEAIFVDGFEGVRF